MPTTLKWIGTSTPGDPGVAANYSPAQVPITGDTLIVENTAQGITANLAVLAAVRLALLVIRKSFTGEIGSSAAYWEVGAARVEIGEHFGQGNPAGSPRMKIDFPYFTGQDGPAITVHDSATTSTDTYLQPIRLLTNDTDAVIEVRKGRVGVAQETSETAVLGTLRTAYASSPGSDADVMLGRGVTVSAVEKTGGKVVSLADAKIATVKNYDGTFETYGAGALGVVTLEGGSVVLCAAGTIDELAAGSGEADFLRSRAARTVTKISARLGSTARIKLDPNVVAIGAYDFAGELAFALSQP